MPASQKLNPVSNKPSASTTKPNTNATKPVSSSQSDSRLQKALAEEGQYGVFAPGCSGTLSHLGACPAEMDAAGTNAAQQKAAAEGALWVIASAIPVGDVLEALGASDRVASVASCLTGIALTIGGSSFAPGTMVLLASGKTVPISDLKPGDKVLAEDTATGKNQAETVTAVEVNHDTDLYNLTVKTSSGTEVIHTTSSHLFWDPSLNYGWIPANHLKPGEKLETPDGQSAVVVGGSVPADHDGWMWDLTVPGNNDHDFYVIAGDTPVLVHNCLEEEDEYRIDEHVAPRHTSTGALNQGKSIFNDDEDLYQLTRGSDGQIGSYQPQTNRIQYVIDAGRNVGVDANGINTQFYTIIRTSGPEVFENDYLQFGDLVTMHPGLP